VSKQSIYSIISLIAEEACERKGNDDARKIYMVYLDMGNAVGKLMKEIRIQERKCDEKERRLPLL